VLESTALVFRFIKRARVAVDFIMRESEVPSRTTR
jgi:hypothetical protein